MKRFDIGLEQTYKKQTSWYPVYSKDGEYVLYSDVQILEDTFRLVLNTVELMVMTQNHEMSKILVDHIQSIREDLKL